MEIENQTKPMIQVSVPMPDKLEQELRNIAASLRISRAELVRQMIDRSLMDFRELSKMASRLYEEIA